MDYRHDIFFSYKRDALTLDGPRPESHAFTVEGPGGPAVGGKLGGGRPLHRGRRGLRPVAPRLNSTLP